MDEENFKTTLKNRTWALLSPPSPPFNSLASTEVDTVWLQTPSLHTPASSRVKWDGRREINGVGSHRASRFHATVMNNVQGPENAQLGWVQASYSYRGVSRGEQSSCPAKFVELWFQGPGRIPGDWNSLWSRQMACLAPHSGCLAGNGDIGPHRSGHERWVSYYHEFISFLLAIEIPLKKKKDPQHNI